MERTKMIHKIHSKLSDLEHEQFMLDRNSVRAKEIDAELSALKLQLKEVMNSVCPLVKDIK